MNNLSFFVETEINVLSIVYLFMARFKSSYEEVMNMERDDRNTIYSLELQQISKENNK